MADTQTEGGGPLAALRGDNGRVLAVVALGWFFTLGMRYLVPTLLPQIKADFGVRNAGGGLAVTAIWAGYALMQFPAGALIDRVGERRLLAGSLFAAAVSLGVLFVSWSFPAFVAGSALFGLATGMFGPARGTTLSRTFSEGQGAAFGFTFAAGSVGSAVLPFLAGVLVGPLGWQATVVLAAPGFLVVSAATWLVVGEREAGEAADGADADSDAAGDPAETDDDRPAPDGGADVSVAGALRDAVSRRNVALPAVAVTLVVFGLEGVTAFLPTYLHDVGGLSSGTASAVFALFFIGGAIGQFTAGSLADRYGDRAVLVGVAALNVVALAVFPFVSGLAALAGVVFVLGTRNGIAPISNSYIIAVLPEPVQGTAWGMLRTGFFLLGSTGSLVFGALGDRGEFDLAFYLVAALTAVAAAIYWFLPDRHSA